VAIDDLYNVQVLCEANSRQFEWGLAYRLSTGSTDAGSMAQLAADFWTLHGSAIKTCMSDEAHVQEIVASSVHGQYIPTGHYELASEPGSAVGGVGQGSNAVVITQYTDAPRAVHNGRLYLGGLAEGWVSNGVLGGAHKVQVEALATSLALTISTTGPPQNTFTPVVLSRYSRGEKRPEPVYFTWTSSVVRDRIYRQKRRTTRRQGYSPAVTAVESRRIVDSSL